MAAFLYITDTSIDNIDYVTRIGNVINQSTANAGFASGPAPVW